MGLSSTAVLLFLALFWVFVPCLDEELLFFVPEEEDFEAYEAADAFFEPFFEAVLPLLFRDPALIS